jgi:hypothetical protein
MTPVMTALNFIRVIYDPEGDGEEAERHLTLIKVKSTSLMIIFSTGTYY